MPTLPSTDSGVRAIKLPRGTTQLEFRDTKTHGLSLIVGKRRRTWSLTYTVPGGKRRRISLGQYPEVGLARARERAEEQRGAVRAGSDPQAAKRAYKAVPTVEIVGEQYLARHASNKVTGDVDARILRKHVFPVIGGMKLVDVRRTDIHRVLDPILERGSGIMANRTLEAVRAVFSWAIDRGHPLEVNPAAKIRRPAKEVARDRILSDDEIKTLWGGLDELSMQGRASIKLLLLTGQREMEVIGARWAEIDFEKRLWTLPVAEDGRSKGRKAVHVVPLSEPAIQVLSELHQRNGHLETVFAGIRRKSGAPPTPSRGIAAKAKSQLVRKYPALNGWRLHDLRRTLRTGLSALRVEPHIAELVIGHSIRGIAAVYDRHSYLTEKRDALERWAAHVMRLVGESEPESTATVVALKGR